MEAIVSLHQHINENKQNTSAQLPTFLRKVRLRPNVVAVKTCVNVYVDIAECWVEIPGPFMFKVNKKDTRTTCLYCWLWTYFTLFSGISILNFEQVNVCWDTCRVLRRYFNDSDKFHICSYLRKFFCWLLVEKLVLVTTNLINTLIANPTK